MAGACVLFLATLSIIIGILLRAPSTEEKEPVKVPVTKVHPS